MKKTVNQAKNSKVVRQDFGVAEDHDSLPELTISEEQLESAHEAGFGREDEIKIVPLTDFYDSDWSHKFEQFYRERIVHVRSNQTLLLRFQYDYEVDLDRINSERDLLSWALHLCGKAWMTSERVGQFIEAVAKIKKLTVHGGGL